MAALLLVASLHAGLLQQLAVLLLRHALATLLDDRAHEREAYPAAAGGRPGATRPRRRSAAGRRAPRSRAPGRTGRPGPPAAGRRAPAGRPSSSTPAAWRPPR